MRPADISIGTSGWRFDDWAGTFYPLRVPPAKWLEYYAARFPVGEINSTYYRISSPATYAAIDRKTPAGFVLFAKLHSDATHKRSNPAASVAQLLAALEPLRISGKLAGLLAQFPASFHYNAESRAYLRQLQQECDGVPLCTEFRHCSWMDETALRFATDHGLTWVCPDEPELPDLMPRRFLATTDMLYVRLHGRNAAAWYDRRAGNRYDYNYSEAELVMLGREILHVESPARRGYVLFNNCYAGQAPRNAQWLKLWLETLGQNPHAVHR